MARIRTIKPEFPQSETMGKLSRDARLLFIQLWTIADDEGRARASSRMLASLLYPYDDDAKGQMDGWLEELERLGCIRCYEADGSSYLEIVNWLKHQKIDKPSKSRLPAFVEFPRIFANVREASATDLGPSTLDLGPKEPAAKAARSSDWPSDFRDQFWEAFPRKLEKKAAFKSLERVRSSGAVPWGRFIAAVRTYAATADPQFTKHPTTWLSKGCWDDELPKSSSGTPGTAATITPECSSWNVWKAHFRDTNQNTRAMLMDKSASDGKAFTVPSEYPPGYKKDAA